MDFSRGFVHGFNAVVIPLKTSSNMWYFTDPFTNMVWILVVISIPIYIVAMALAYSLFSVSADWHTLSGFVIRNALSEQNYRIPHQAHAYQKILIITWLGCTLVLLQAYAGSLTAMLSKPKFPQPIKTLGELLRQKEISWAIEKGSMAEIYMQAATTGTMMNLLYKRAEFVPKLTTKERTMYGCYAYAAKQRGNGRFGSFCYLNYIWSMIARDFSATGKCNFYITEEKLVSEMSGAVFQVNTTICCNYKSHLIFFGIFQAGSPFLEDFNYLVDLKDQMGLKLSEDSIKDYVPNTTKCMTWQDVKASHDSVNTPVIIVEDFYGIIILLIFGLGIAMATLTLECLTKALMPRFKKTTRGANQWLL